jgi:trk system potassium uptake protein TrkH
VTIKRLISVLRVTSSLLFVESGLLLLPLFFSFLYREDQLYFITFLISSLITLLFGIFLRVVTHKQKTKMDLATSMLLTSFSWFILSLFGSIPFMIGLDKSFIDALFESVSGFTTTGITVFEGLDYYPHSIMFWRSLIQWLGGLGILTFFLFVTTSSEGDLWQLFSSEGHKIGSTRPFPNIYHTIKVFWIIYGAFTLIETIVLTLLGLSPFEAFIHSLTTLSTGGFSNHDASIAYYANAGFTHYKAIEYTITFFMLLGGINFFVHYKWIKEDHFYWFKDIETKTYLNIILIFSFITILGMILMNGFNINYEESFRKTIFQMVSLITTTGFGTEDIGSSMFPTVTKQLFIVLMIIGGSVGSTAGGLKIMRFIILNKLIRREVDKIYLPRKAIVPVSINGNIIGQDEVMRVSGIVFSWIMLIGIGAGITAMFSDLDAFQSFSGMASAVGNIGPFYFSVSKMASLSPVIKITYIIGMLAGRLELLPIYILLSIRAWRS